MAWSYTESGNNTASSSWAVSHPAASTGDLLIFNIGWDDSTTTSTLTAPSGPNGETAVVIEDVRVSSNTSVRGKIVYYVATGSWSASTITFTPGASEQWSAVVVKVPSGEFDATTPIGADNYFESTTTDSTPDLPSLTAGSTDGGGTVVGFMVGDVDDADGTITGWTSRASTDRGAVGVDLWTRDTTATDSESISAATGATYPSARDYVSFIYIIRVQRAPTVALNSPADASSGSDTTPTLDFTGTDGNSDDIRYQVQVTSGNTPDVIDSYSETNNDVGYSVYSTFPRRAQSFQVSSDKYLSSISAYIQKSGSPTGTLVAKIYSHSGSYGSTGVPLAELASSDSIDISTLSTSNTLVEFTFSSPYNILLSSSTNYFVSLEYSGGDISNRVVWRGDSSSPSHGGNMAVYSGGSWSADSSVDFCFYVYGYTLILHKFSGYEPQIDHVTSLGNTNGTSRSASHTTTNHPNRMTLIVVTVDAGSPNDVNSVTVGGNAATQIADSGYGGNKHAEIWYYLNPPVGSSTVAVNTDSAFISAAVYDIYNVDQADPFSSTAQTATGTNGSPTDNITPDTALSLIVDILCSDSAQANPDNGTLRHTQSFTFNETRSSSRRAVDTSAKTMSYGTGAGDWAMAVVAIKPASGDTGFANPDNGGDTDPFTSGENIQYTVQGGDALTDGTYYWRVRGIDPSGSNTYGDWSSTRSFTISSATDVNPTPGVISNSFTIPAPTISTVKNITINPSAISNTLSLPTSTISAVKNISISPNAIALTGSVQSQTISIGDSVSAGVISLTSTLPAPSVTTVSNITLTPNAISLTGSIPAATPSVNDSVVADVLTGTASIPNPSITTTASVSVQPNVIVVNSSLPSQTVTAVKNVSQTPSAISNTLSLPTPTISTVKNVSISPNVLSLSSTIQAPAVGLSTTITPNPVSLVGSVQGVGISIGDSVTPNAISLSSTIPSPAISAIKNVNITPNAISLTSSVQSPIISIDESVSLSVITASLTIPNPTITAVKNPTVNAGVINTSTTIAQPSITAVKNVSMTPQPIVLTASIVSPTISVNENLSIDVLNASFTLPNPSVVVDGSLDVTINVPVIQMGARKFIFASDKLHYRIRDDYYVKI